jgi:hypothetical protein
MHVASRRKFSTTLAALVLAGLLAATLAAGIGCGKEDAFSLDYVDSFANVVIQVKSFGGMPAPWDDYAPDFTLYGNGTVVMRGESLQEPMRQGKMNPGDIDQLLAGIRDAGFFDLKTWYEDRSVYDYVTISIEVTLEERNQKVTDYFLKVEAFSETLQAITDAPVKDLKDYTPSRGYLVVQKHEAAGTDVVIEAGSDIYSLLPPAPVLQWAAAANQAVAIPGKDFARIKRYAADHGTSGLVVKADGGDLILYPVYEPR